MSWAHAYWATKVQSLGEHSAAGKPHDGTKTLNRWGNAKYIGYSYTNTWTWNGEAVCFQKTQIMEVFLFSLQLKSSFFLWNPRKPFQPGPTKPISTGRQQNGWKTPGLATHCVNETEQDEWPQPAQCFMTERKKLWIVCGKTASHQFTALYCFYTKPQWWDAFVLCRRSLGFKNTVQGEIWVKFKTSGMWRKPSLLQQ